MSIIWSTAEQGSEEWLAVRRGAITGSRARDVRDRLKNGDPSKASLMYAMDTARERCGGSAAPVFVNAAMRMGTEQEPIARQEYEARTGELVIEVGFARTDDGRFGCSVDGLIGSDGIWECKTMVSSDTLFTSAVDGDIGAYRDQCLFAMWLLSRKWVDLSLWCPDLRLLRTVRIARDEQAIERLEADLVAFDRLVSSYEARLRARLEPITAECAPMSDTYQPASVATEAEHEFIERLEPTGDGKAVTPGAGNAEAAPNTPKQATQQVLKAEAETPDATDRDAPANASPVGGPMGAGQPAAAGPILASYVEHVAEQAIRDIANGLNGVQPMLGQWQRDLRLARAVEAAAVAAERAKYAPLMQAVEWLLDDGHMDTGHLARLRAAWDALGA